MSASMVLDHVRQTGVQEQSDPFASRGESGSFHFHHFAEDPNGLVIVFRNGDILRACGTRHETLSARSIECLEVTPVCPERSDGAYMVHIVLAGTRRVLLAQWKTFEAANYWAAEITQTVGYTWK